MDERYSRLQSVIDDLIGERGRILDEALEMSKDLQEARRLAQEYRDHGHDARGGCLNAKYTILFY